MFIVSLGFILGVAFAYVFLPGRTALIMLAAVFTVAAIIFHFKADRRAFVIFVVSAIVFLIAGNYCLQVLGKIDPLEKYAVSPYNNADFAVAVTGPAFKISETPVITGRVVKIAQGQWNSRLTVYGCEEKGSSGNTNTENEKPKKRNILIRLKGDEAPYELIGKQIRIRGAVEMPPGKRNPGCFDYALYLKTQGIRVIIKTEPSKIEVLQHKNLFWDFYAGLGNLKYDYLDKVRIGMDDKSFSLMAGMMFGDKSELDETIYEQFQHAGVAHILSVSGLHVMIVYAFISLLLTRRKGRGPLSLPVNLIIIFALVCYAILSEFSPSVLRAVTMILIHIVSGMMKARYDLLTGTSLAMLLMLIKNPLMLFHTGFQLSFLAVFLLAFFLPFAKRFLRYRDELSKRELTARELIIRGKDPLIVSVPKRISENLLPVVLLQLFMAPVIAWYFGYISFTGFITNPPVCFLAGLILPIGLLMFLFSALGSVASFFSAENAADIIFRLLSGLGEFLNHIILRLCEWADSLSVGHVQVFRPPLQILLIFYSLLFFCGSEGFRIFAARIKNGSINKEENHVDIDHVRTDHNSTTHIKKNHIGRKTISTWKTGLLIILLLISCSLSTLLSPVCQQDKSALVFVDVAQGDCLHVRTPDGRNYLIDGGGQLDYNIGKNVLLQYLHANGIGSLDGIFVTHLHTDHWKGISELMSLIKVKRLYLYEGNSALPGNMNMKGLEISMAVKESGTQLKFIAAGDTVSLADGVNIRVLWPPRKSKDEYSQAMADDSDENKNSLILLLNYSGITTLMTGDLGEDGEKELIRQYSSGKSSGSRSALHADILKIGHHGSKYSTSETFLEAVSPRVAVIQVGRNTFGHPTPDVLEKLDTSGIIILRNDLMGAVKIGVKDGAILYAEGTGTRIPKNRK